MPKKIAKNKSTRRPGQKKSWPGEHDKSRIAKIASREVRKADFLGNKKVQSDDVVNHLDAALDAAEVHLRKLLPFHPRDIARHFENHVHTHLTDEMCNIAKHGHRSDDPDDPNYSTFVESVTQPTSSAIWSLYSDDDNVVLFDTEKDALEAKKRWLDAGANGVAGPFEHSNSATDDKPTQTARTNDAEMREFVSLVARMKTLEEFGDDPPEQDDWIETLNNLIGEARKIAGETKSR